MAALAPALTSAPPATVGLLANLVGFLAEKNVDPGLAADAFAARLVDAVDAARRFSEIVQSQAGGTWPRKPRSRAAMNSTHAEMPEEAATWDLLDELLAPTIAILPFSASARTAARAGLSGLSAIRELNPNAAWIEELINTLYDEPFVAIEPATQLGIRGRISGISLNFRLNVLLMALFPQTGWRPKPRVSASALEVARGEGPQQTDETITGAWNLYGWTAIEPDGKLPDAKAATAAREHWIWNEGIPADIPVFGEESSSSGLPTTSGRGARSATLPP